MAEQSYVKCVPRSMIFQRFASLGALGFETPTPKSRLEAGGGHLMTAVVGMSYLTDLAADATVPCRERD
jgi:hypothetical protein